jgi:hypothetical protein
LAHRLGIKAPITPCVNCCHDSKNGVIASWLSENNPPGEVADRAIKANPMTLTLVPIMVWGRENFQSV